MSSFARMSVADHTDALAVNLPSGRVWLSKFKPTSNLRKLLTGLAPTFRTMDATCERLIDQFIPPDTQDLLSEWETALGIPSSCFPIENTDDGRRLTLRIKLAVLAGVTTRQDFIDLGALFGLTIDVGSGIEHVATGSGGYGTKTPVLTIPGDFANVATARLTMVVIENTPESVTFPWEFSAAGPVVPVGLKFALDTQNTLRCLIKKLAPANIDVLFVEA